MTPDTFPSDGNWCPTRGGQGDSESLTLVLKGNNPRFPWEPSTTMLTYRLTGTTEASATNRDEHVSLFATASHHG